VIVVQNRVPVSTLALFYVHTIRILSFHGDSMSITLRKFRCVVGDFGGIFRLPGEYSVSIFRVIVSRELAVTALWVPPSPNLFVLGLLTTYDLS
jgi:hypothetical protein